MNKIFLRVLWGIAGVLLIAAGIVWLCNPGITLAALALMLGIILLVAGIIDIVIFAKYNRIMFGAAWFLVDGILTVILSIFLIFNAEFTVLSMPFIFCMWLIFSGVDRFVMSFDLKYMGVRGWGWMMALGIVMTAAGLFTFLDPIFRALTMTVIAGVLMILRGIVAIVQAVMAGRYLH